MKEKEFWDGLLNHFSITNFARELAIIKKIVFEEGTTVEVGHFFH